MRGTIRRFEIYYEVALSKVQRQDAWNRDLESKATRYSAASVAIVGLVIAIVQNEDVAFEGWRACLAAAAAAAFLGNILVTLIVLLSRDFQNTPNLASFSEHLDSHGEKPKDVWVRWAGDEFKEAYEHNRKILDLKARWIRVSEVLTGLTIVLSLLVAVLAVFGL